MNTIRVKFGEKWNIAFVIYLALFLLLCLFVIIGLVIGNKSFVRDGDTFTQHYPAFLYIGRWYRNSICGCIIYHKIPRLWDFAIGYGADIFNTLTYYCLFDWSTVIFAVFSNEQSGPVLYTAMMLFRTFLCGIAFIAYCRRMKCSTLGAVFASFGYILCPYMLDNVFNGHHFFSLPLMYLPVILILCEKVISREKCLPFIPVISAFAMGSVYYFYMSMIFSSFYIAFRCLINQETGKKIDNLVSAYLRFAGVVIVGLMIAMPVLLPEISELLANPRMTTKVFVPSLYTLDQYHHAIDNFVGSDSFSYYSYVGVSPCILFGVFFLFAKKRDIWLKCLWFVSLISVLIPRLGYWMNGFSYVANRHVWIFVFLTVFIFAYEFDYFFETKQRIVPIVLASVYMIVLIIIKDAVKLDRISAICIFSIMIASLLVSSSQKTLNKIIIGILLFTGITVHIISIFGNRGGGWNKFIEISKLQ